jgi:hypothetical protein
MDVGRQISNSRSDGSVASDDVITVIKRGQNEPRSNCQNCQARQKVYAHYLSSLSAYSWKALTVNARHAKSRQRQAQALTTLDGRSQGNAKGKVQRRGVLIALPRPSPSTLLIAISDYKFAGRGPATGLSLLRYGGCRLQYVFATTCLTRPFSLGPSLSSSIL